MNYKVFLINLDRSTQRLADVKAQLDKLKIPFERISATDGSCLTERDYAFFDRKTAAYRYHYDLTSGEVGCYLSHIRCWQKIVDEKLDYAIILEDDLNLSPNFAALPDTIKNLPKDWEFIKLSNPFKARQEAVITEYDKFNLVKYDKAPSGTCAQVVSFVGAKKLLKARHSFFRPVDVDLQWQWETGAKVLGLIPYPVDNNHQFGSDIQNIEQRKNKQKRRFIKLKESFRFKWKQYISNRT